MMQAKLEGEWIHVERSVPDEAGQRIIGMGVKNAGNGVGDLSLSVDGEESSFDGTLTESQLPEFIAMVSESAADKNTRQDSLPDDFFDRLSTRQLIFLKILLEHDEPVTGPEIRDEMRTKYNQEVSDSGSGTAGIISGFTRKYGKDFRSDLIGGRVSHHNDEGSRVFEHWIGDKYEEELREYVETRNEGNDE